MRPRKVVVLFCADEDRRSELRYMLTLKGFRVVGMGELAAGADAALVIGNPVPAAAVNAARVLLEEYGVNTLVEVPQPQWSYYPLGTLFVIPNNLPEMVCLLKVAAAGKRGRHRTPTFESSRPPSQHAAMS